MTLRLVPLVLAHALAAGVELQSGFILDGEQDGCFIAPRVSYKYAPGDVFPNEPAHPHGLRLADSPAECCAMCKALITLTLTLTLTLILTLTLALTRTLTLALARTLFLTL